MDKQVTRHKGIDCFMTDPGSLEEAHCNACGTLMEVRRDVEVARSFAEAMGNMKRPSDSFSCPESKHDWHKQVIALMLEKGRTNSAKLAALLQEEIDEILVTKEPTKAGCWY